MIPERYQVSAVPVGGGDRITGYYCFNGWTDNRKHYIIPDCESAFYGLEIDHATIEPARVRPIRVKWEFAWKDGQYRHFCPNCESDCIVVKDENKLEYCLDRFGQPDYCPWCGMALDWSDDEEDGVG